MEMFRLLSSVALPVLFEIHLGFLFSSPLAANSSPTASLYEIVPLSVCLLGAYDNKHRFPVLPSERKH